MAIASSHTGRSGEELNRLIARLYDCALEEEEWADVLNAISDFCKVENSALVIVDKGIGYSSVTTPRADPVVVEEYQQFWWMHDPTVEATARAQRGLITSLEDTGRERFFKSSFFNDYWRRSGLGSERLASNLIVESDHFASFVLQTSTRNDLIEAESLRHFEALLPHLIRATRLSQKLRRLEQINAAVARNGQHNNQGRILVSIKGKIIHADNTADEIMSRNKMLSCRNGYLVLSDDKAARQLSAAIEKCSRLAAGARTGSGALICRGPDGGSLKIEVLPLHFGTLPQGATFAGRAVAVVSVTDEQADTERRIAFLRERFQLTRAEASLATEMLAGDGRAAAAQRCGISINTARTHLMRVFEKTGVRRQAELVSLLHRSLDE